MSEPPFRELLTKYRELKGLSQEQVASHLGCSSASVSRWANGHSLPQRETAEKLDKFLNADKKLFAAWRLGRTGTVTPEWARSLSAIEQAAQTLQCVSPVLVPGYLQCAEYAHWVFRLGWPQASDKEIEYLTHVRTRRLGELPGLRITSVFPVTALTGSPEKVRQAQAQHLLTVIRKRDVSVHVVPEGSILAAVTSPLLVFRLRSGETVISSDHVDGNVIYENSEGYDRLASLITGALAASLPAEHSRQVLEGLTT
jgi:transcriptional regulator with XRE-family HTH domain